MSDGWGTGGVHVGPSGWNYPEWRGKFYPADLPKSRELGYVGDRFDTLEINSSFYRLQAESTYAKWSATVPEDFQFSVKGWKQVTHIRRLTGADEDIARFFGSGVLALGRRLGPVLWQLPPSLRFDATLLDDFLGALPTTIGAARTLGAASGPEDLTDQPIRYAVEPRTAGFGTPEALEVFARHDVALVNADSAGKHPRYDAVTGSMIYLRLHGSPRMYFSNYSDETLAALAARIKAWRADGLDSYVYFDNTGAGHAPNNAETLLRMIG